MTGTKNEETIEEEVAQHGKTWCIGCKAYPDGTFLPDEYRDARKTSSKKVVQEQYDLCHIWR